MTAYFVDLGFDWNATQLTDIHGNPLFSQSTNPPTPLFELQWGLVNMTGATSMASMNFQNGDTVQFNIYDVTQLNGSRATASGAIPNVSNPWMTCVKGDTNTTAACGFQDLTGMNAAAVSTSAANGTSTYFGPPAGPVWPINTVGQVVYPAGMTTDASFRLTWAVFASLGGNQKLYVVDPEMIVKPTGGG
jgi:hypothetical protein